MQLFRSLIYSNFFCFLPIMFCGFNFKIINTISNYAPKDLFYVMSWVLHLLIVLFFVKFPRLVFETFSSADNRRKTYFMTKNLIYGLCKFSLVKISRFFQLFKFSFLTFEFNIEFCLVLSIHMWLLQLEYFGFDTYRQFDCNFPLHIQFL